MASHFANSAKQMEVPSSYPEASIPVVNVLAYMNCPPSANSQLQSSPIDASETVSSHEFSSWRNPPRNGMFMINQGPNLQGQGLSLSLGTELSSGLVQNSDPIFSHLGLNSATSNNGINQDSLNRELESHHGNKTRNNPEFTPNEFHYGNQDHDEAKMDCSMFSKYLDSIQQLLDELVSIRRVLEQPRSKMSKDIREDGEGSIDGKTSPSEDEDKSSDISPAERLNLQAKQMKLLTMLDEIDRRYKQYYNQIQILETSFDSAAGCGATRAYTALAVQAISRHFRSLRGAVNDQIRVTQNSRGEQQGSAETKGERIPRLRYVDQKLKQQKALQQFSLLQPHNWRPQRGLPESSVSILRAWLFEHFLHPYPKDSDKIVLAKQTGLSRSQVSNWFINARVRLWKPMIEEIYKEEINSIEMSSSPEHTTVVINSEVVQASDTSSVSKSINLTDFKAQKCIHDEETENGSTYFPGPSLQLGLQHHEILVAETAEASSPGETSFRFLSSEHHEHRFGSSYVRNFAG